MIIWQIEEFANFHRWGKWGLWFADGLSWIQSPGKPGSSLGGIFSLQHCVQSNTHGWHQQPEIDSEVPHSTENTSSRVYFAEKVVLAPQSAQYCRRIQDHYSVECLNKACLLAHLSRTLLKQLHLITVASTISFFLWFFCICICFFLFVSASWRQCKTNFASHKSDISSVKRFRFIQISCHLYNS